MGTVGRNLSQRNNMKFLLVLAMAAYVFAQIEEKLPPQGYKREADPAGASLVFEKREADPAGAPMVYDKREADPSDYTYKKRNKQKKTRGKRAAQPKRKTGPNRPRPNPRPRPSG